MEKTLYPKTPRVGVSMTTITEKLDGSNLGFFKINGKLLIAQRNHCFYIDELDNKLMYKGLVGWLKDNAHKLDLHEGSGVFGEWIGMGKINYNGTDIDKRFYIFAKANIDEKLEVRNIIYRTDLFIYPFESKEIPDCMGVVPTVDFLPTETITALNELYDNYIKKVGRDVEGFIINNNNIIKKYVRYKNGKFTEHQENFKD